MRFNFCHTDTGPIQPSEVDMGSGDSESLFVITSTEDSVAMTPTPTPEGMLQELFILKSFV